MSFCVRDSLRSAALALLFVGLFVLLWGVRPASATDPRLSNIRPQGGQRGTELEVTFSGARLADAQELLFTEPGIEVKQITPIEKNANAVKATLAIRPDCRLGIRGVRVRTATGVTDLRTFHVGALPVIQETEPNNEFDQPQQINLDVTVMGVVQNEDVDYFSVQAKKGERITCEIEGLRLGRTFFDPYVGIFDAKRFELAGSDDAALLHQDATCAVVAPEDGTYIIQVRESAFQGNGACTYRLHLGRYPRPRAVYPAGGKPGEKVTVRWLGDPAGEWSEEVTLPTEPGHNFRLYPQDEYGIAPSGNVFRVNDLENALEAEPNNEIKQATAGSAPGAMNGIISAEGDVDYFQFAAKKGQRYDIRVYARQLRTPLDTVLEVYRENGGRLANNDDSGGPDSYVRFQAPEDGNYFVKVGDHLGAGGEHYVYRVEITPNEPQLTMSLPERQRYVATRVSVPAGNRTAVMVNARRESFRSELALDFRDLPPGVSFETLPMAENQNSIPVVFSAAPDAKPAGSLVDLVGRATAENMNIEGHLQQTNLLVRGQGNRVVWAFEGHRMALAVAEQVPFKIDIVQPKAPIVRNGSMQLKIVAERKEGYNDAIRVRMLYNPPGLSSSGSVSIPAGKNEASIPISANGNAQLGTWKIVVTGEANVDGGSVLVCSGFADLTVAEPFFGLEFPKVAVEQGQQVELPINVENRTPFDGSAKIELVGLPAGATSEALEMTKESEQLSFAIQTTDKARPGRHKTLLCRATIMVQGEPVLHTIGRGELRIDKPLPKKVEEPKKEAQPAAKPKKVAEKPKERPLTRLEKLRLEREKKKAALQEE